MSVLLSPCNSLFILYTPSVFVLVPEETHFETEPPVAYPRNSPSPTSSFAHSPFFDPNPITPRFCFADIFFHALVVRSDALAPPAAFHQRNLDSFSSLLARYRVFSTFSPPHPLTCIAGVVFFFSLRLSVAFSQRRVGPISCPVRCHGTSKWWPPPHRLLDYSFATTTTLSPAIPLIRSFLSDRLPLRTLFSLVCVSDLLVSFRYPIPFPAQRF